MAKGHEQVTAAGYLRSCSVTAEPQLLQPVSARLAAVDPALWSHTPGADQLYYAARLWPQISAGNNELAVQLDYAETRVGTALSYRHPFREIKMPGGAKIAIERAQVGRFTLSPQQSHQYFDILTAIANGANTCDTLHLPAEILPFEQIGKGLAPYF